MNKGSIYGLNEMILVNAAHAVFRLQYGRLFLECFLKLGMPLLDYSFKKHKVTDLFSTWCLMMLFFSFVTKFDQFAIFPSGGCSEFTEDLSAQHQAAPSHVWPLKGYKKLCSILPSISQSYDPHKSLIHSVTVFFLFQWRIQLVLKLNVWNNFIHLLFYFHSLRDDHTLQIPHTDYYCY